MATDGATMTFFAFPREIRDLIYTFLTPKDKTYTITSANTVALAKAFSTLAPDLGIINTSKTVQYEMLETLCPNNTFRFSFPGSDTKTQSMDLELAELMTHIEIYIDLEHFHWERFRVGRHDHEIHGISGQVCEVLRVWNGLSVRRETCRITIKDGISFISPLLRLPFLDAVKTLVGLDTLLIIVLKFKWDLRKLGAVLGPSLGPSTVHYRWPLLEYVDRDYGCIKFHPRRSLAERLEQAAGENMAH
ncbi:hypothetical protein HO133_007755 [Letharia lupina]|uniref:F-box domain-containing protein n=1 Tax=Letharia lupina TaxID=560253 RepID=A0A8H6CR34_9LECA|nr:uncharacterized protein HO133_007755 [Letharia lupina]KAF6228027.1 hypothetical protein HO133_007755 [Letharia lupina]